MFIVYSLMFSSSLHPINAYAETKPLSRDAGKHFFHQSFNDLENEIEIAKETGKKGVFIMFNDKNCPWCMKMKKTVLNQVAVQDYYRKHFQLLIIDTLGDNAMNNFDGNEMTEKDFAFKIHHVRATPVFMFFDTTGKTTMRYTGTTRTTEEFLWLGEFIVSGKYKKMKFAKYKQEKNNSHRQ